MTQTEIQKEFNNVIEQLDDPNTIAKLEVCREYFTNDDFKQTLEEAIWKINQQ